LMGAAFGYHRGMDTIGAVIGPLIAVVLLELDFSLREILWFAVIPGALTLLLVRRLREAPAESPHAAKASEVTAEKVSALPGSFWTVLAIWVVFSLGNSSDAFLVLRARDLGLGVVVVVLAYAVYNVIYCSLSWPFGALSDRIPRSVLLGGGLAVFALVYFGFAVTSHGWTVWPLFAVYGIYIAATEGVARAWIADTLPDRAAVGTAYGIFFLTTAAASLVASVVAGVLWTYVSPRAPFVVGAAAAVAALVFLVGFEVGWQARARTIKVALLTAGAIVVAGAVVAVTFEHHRLAEAFRTGQAEPLPAAFARPCGAAPNTRVHVAFPDAGSTYTRRTLVGPTAVLNGFRSGAVTAANAAYRSALVGAGYTVLRSEVDPADSEVVFRNGTTTGQVSMTQECRGRVRLRITIRPA
jgi:MFS family permease